MPDPARQALPGVGIERVGEGNREGVLLLEVAEEHVPYVSPVAEVLEGIGEDPAIECHAVRADGAGGAVAGFLALDFDEGRVRRYAEGRRPYGLRNYLISSGQQGRGLGQAAIPEIRDLLHRAHPEASHLYLSVNRRNKRAIRTYLGAGFRDTGRLYHGGASGLQHVLRLPLG